MTRDKINYTHGSGGVRPDEGSDFTGGEVVEKEPFNWYWNTIPLRIDQLWDEFIRIDNDDDGVVDEADYANDADASTYKGNDIDSDSDGAVETAEYANDADASTYKGNDIDSDGDGIVNEANSAVDASASTYKTVDIDSDGDGVVDTADYANDADASTYKGNDIDSDGDGTVDVSDVFKNIEPRTADPSSPANGRVWFRTDTLEVRMQTQRGVSKIPLGTLGETNSPTYEYLRMEYNGTTYYLPVVSQTDATHDHIRINTQDGDLAFNDNEIVPKTVTSFESGNVNDWNGNTADWEARTDGTSNIKDGSYMLFPWTGAFSLGTDDLWSLSGDGLQNYFNYGETLKFGFDVKRADDVSQFEFMFAKQDGTYEKNFSFYNDINDGTFGLKENNIRRTGGSSVLAGESGPRVVEIAWGPDGGNTIEFTVYDENGNQVFSTSGFESQSYQSYSGIGFAMDGSSTSVVIDNLRIVDY